MATLVAADVQLILNTVLVGNGAYDGTGNVASVPVTVGQALRLILAYCAGNGSNLDTTNGQAIIKSLDGLRNAVVANLVNGVRTVTSYDAGG